MKKIMPIMLIGILIISGIGVIALPMDNNLQFYSNLKSYNLFLDGPQEEWNRTYGGNKWDEFNAVELTADGGYVLGGTKEANGYDDDGDCWLFKTDSYGNIEWDKTYGGQDSERGTDICKTTDGGYAIIGFTRSFGAGGIDIYLIKTNATGNEQWNKTFGGQGDDYGLAIQKCSDEGFIIAGATRSYGSNEAWLIKTDAAGTMQWEKRFCSNNPPGGYFMTVLQTAEEDYIAAGRNYIDDTSEIIIVKTDGFGNVIWEKLLGDPDYKDSALDIAATSDGNYIVTGQVLHPETEHDIVLMKIDNNGDEIWTRNFNETPFFDTGISVEETNDGGFLIAGEIGTNLNNPVMYDLILIKTDSTGKKEWSMIFGGSGSDSCYEALQTPDEGYIAAGYTSSYGAGSLDAWLLKLASFENQRPDTPLRPSGPTSGRINEDQTYTTQANDPDNDEIYYFWDWGDGSDSGWLGPFDSGEECSTSHIWSEQGNYEIRGKAKDIHGAESDWSDPLSVSMPKTKNEKSIKPLFLQFLQNHPLIYQLLQRLLKL